MTSPPAGVARYCFDPVCMHVCMSVCPANILVFYFSVIRKEMYIGYLNRVVLNSLKIIYLHRSKVKVAGIARYCFDSVCMYVCVSGQYFGILFLGY